MRKKFNTCLRNFPGIINIENVAQYKWLDILLAFFSDN